MFKRQLTKTLREFARSFPAVAILGPRQSGKTTLAKETFKKYKYVSMEDFDTRSLAIKDPRYFLESLQNSNGIIIDEFQHVPLLLSYMQGFIDNGVKSGYFILTGSHNFLMNQSITQSLAGRVGILTLLPLSIQEMKKNNILPEKLDSLIVKGAYPRIYANNLKPKIVYPSYIQTYIERDVRLLKNVENLSLFQKFIELCAGRTGQILNISSLASDCGISSHTANSWLSILEASYIIFLLRSYHNNVSKRIMKSPKLYFYDTGIVCSLLAIENEDQLSRHYLRGGIFESLIISEVKKHFFNEGSNSKIYYWRDNHGNEVDCIIADGDKNLALEIKSGTTIDNEFFKGLKYWEKLSKSKNNYLIYGGNQSWKLKNDAILSWQLINQIFKKR